MIKKFNFFSYQKSITVIVILFFALQSCNEAPKEVKSETAVPAVTHEYFNLRPKVEKDYGYSHAVKIGDDIKISGAVSMDDGGNLISAGDMDLQMKNCYSDLEHL